MLAVRSSCPETRIVERSAVRHKTFERTTITIAGTTATAHVLNLSMTGALLHADAPVIRSVHVLVGVGGRSVSGEVMWVEGARFGVRFDRPLANEQVEMLLR